MHLGKYKSGYISITDKQSVSNMHKTAAVCVKLANKTTETPQNLESTYLSEN